MDAIQEENDSDYSDIIEGAREIHTAEDSLSLSETTENEGNLKIVSESPSPLKPEHSNESYPDPVKGFNMISTLHKVKSFSSQNSIGMNTEKTFESGKSLEETLDNVMKTIGDAGLQNRMRSRGKTIYTSNLTKISQGVRVGDESETIRIVLGRQTVVGKKKLKKSELCLMLAEEWKKTDVFYTHTAEGNQYLTDSLKNTHNQYTQAIQNRDQLKQEIQTLKALISHEKAHFDGDIKGLRVSIENTSEDTNLLLEIREKTENEYNERLEKQRETEEKWRMKVEDLTLNLINLKRKNTKTQQQNELDQQSIKGLEHHSELQTTLLLQTQHLAFILSDVSEFLTHSADTSLYGSLHSLFSDLQHRVYDAMEAHTLFKHQATTNPKALLPYTRTSNRF